jgi:hypothetical protein
LAAGKLMLDPLYQQEGRDEVGDIRLRRVFPSAWFEYENAESRFKDYLPETVCVTDKTMEDLSQGYRTPEIEKLLRQCVVIGFPDGYLPTNRSNKDKARSTKAIAGGAFYIEKISVADLIAAMIPQDHSFIMIDENEWDVGDIGGGRRALGFLQRDGQYFGPPADDKAATCELERLRQAGATFVVFGLRPPAVA